jgi:hypothetical protein
MIPHIYKNYYQKSKTFLFPALGIKKGPHTTPIDSYISWNPHISAADKKLICLYDLANPFHEKTAIDSFYCNPLFIDYFENKAEQRRVYIFDMDIFHEDFDHFLTGRYSCLSNPLKTYIANYFGRNSPEYQYVQTFLYPWMFYDLYSNLLNINVELLYEVGELTDRYDPEKENLKLFVKSLQSSTKALYL